MAIYSISPAHCYIIGIRFKRNIWIGFWKIAFIIIGIYWIGLTEAIAQGRPIHKGVLTEDNGLSQSINASFYKDSYGFIWISSVAGLNRFDGQHTKVYRSSDKGKRPMHGDNIQSNFFEDQNGDIWFSTDMAINCYRRASDDFEYFYASSLPITQDQPHKIFFMEKNRFLWVRADTMIYRFDIKTKKSSPLHASLGMNCTVFEHPETKAILFMVSCSWHLKNGFEIIEYNEDLSIKSKNEYCSQKYRSTPELMVNNAIVDSGKVIWLSTNKGLLLWDKEQTTNYNLFQLDGQKTNNIRHIFNYSRNALGIVSGEGHLWIFDKTKRTFKPFDKSLNNPFYVANRMETYSGILDRDSILWLSFYNKGISYQNSKIGNFQKNNSFISKSNIWQVVQDYNKSIWYIDQQGHVIVWSSSGHKLRQLKINPYSKIYFDPNRDLCWILSRTSVQLCKGSTLECLKTWELVNQSPQSEGVVVGNHFIFGQFDGIYNIDTKSMKLEKVYTLDNVPLCFYMDKSNHLWIGTDKKIIICQQSPIGRQLISVKEIPLNSFTTCIHPDISGNKIWVGTETGLVCIDPNLYQPLTIRGIEQLENRRVSIVLNDKEGNIWTGADPQIIKVHANLKKIEQFSVVEGMKNTKFHTNAGLLLSNGEIMMGGLNGVDIFNPNDLIHIGRPPDLAISGFFIHGKSWLGSSSILQTKAIELPYFENTLRFDLAAMEYTDPSLNQFRARLLGSDTNWVDLGTQNFITYPNLYPGHYVFQFTACNAEGIWQITPKSLEIRITPPYYQTWWFRAILAAIIIGLAIAITAFYYRYRLRVQQLQTEKQLREAERQRLELEKNTAAAESSRKIAESEMKLLRSQLNPHFLFNAMNSVNRYILSNEREKASEYLGQFAQLTRSILENSRSLTITLADELKMLGQYIALESHRFNQQILWNIDLDPDLDDDSIQVPAMFLQPFTENAILHGLAPKGGGNISVSIRIDDQRLLSIVRDDGVGRLASSIDIHPTKRTSVGMQLISERLDAFAALEGQKTEVVVIDLKDENGHAIGTEVQIWIPLLMR
jgi:ligand-binding sensor domain-containing protein/two-component sensor histidine kinase